MPRNRIDLTGMKFGRWTVGEVAKRRDGDSRLRWSCLCLCGTSREVPAYRLIRGESKSCGCLTKEVATKMSFKHGHANTCERPFTPTYHTWVSMLTRCNNFNHPSYKSYGGRGISVCREWHTFSNFLRDMGERPHGLVLDRINNELGYFKNNCRWVTHKNNCRNTRQTRIVEFKGQLKPLIELEELLGLNTGTVRSRLRRGWTVEKALALPTKAERGL